MKEILAETSPAKMLCGAQKIIQDKSYRRSSHIVSAQCEDGTLLFHTLTGAMYLFDNGETPEDHRDHFIKNRFLVPEDFDDNAYADGIRTAARVLQPKHRHITSFTILTTTDCNARCFYCYEMGRKRENMSAQTALDCAKYIARVCGQLTDKGEKTTETVSPVKLSWFGGEPLYNAEAIDIITSYLTQKDIAFESIITTNGLYLDADTAKKARRDWHLKSAQITIDGTKDVYNRTKAYIDKYDDPHEIVLTNIENALKEGIRIFVRLNMDSKNADDLIRAVDNMTPRLKGKGDCRFLVAMLREFKGKINEFDTEEAAAEKCVALLKKIEEAGFDREFKLDRELHVNRCMADNDGAQVLLPEGLIGKCEHFSETEIIGDIYSPERDVKLIESWKKTLPPFSECEGCPVYPRCYNLAKCDWTKDGCPQSVKLIRIYNLQRQMQRAYNDYKSASN